MGLTIPCGDRVAERGAARAAASRDVAGEEPGEGLFSGRVGHGFQLAAMRNRVGLCHSGPFAPWTSAA
jgi:hypothetical protein